MSFMSPDQKALERVIFEAASCPFCGRGAVAVTSRRTRFDVECSGGHTFSLTGPQIRQARPAWLR